MCSFQCCSEHNKTMKQSICHQNIRSIPKNLTSFTAMLETLKLSFNVYGFTETWLKSHNEGLYDMEGYSTITKNREDRQGGGVAFYIKNL